MADARPMLKKVLAVIAITVAVADSSVAQLRASSRPDQTVSVAGKPRTAEPPPSLITAGPNQFDAGGPDLKVTVNGEAFAQGAVVLWNGISLPVSFQNSKQIQVTVPSSLTAMSGRAALIVRNPDGQNSALYPMYVQPVLKSLSPSTAITGSAPVVWTAIGIGLLPTTGLQVIVLPEARQSLLSGTYVSSTEVKFILPPELVGTANALLVDVTNGVFSRVVQIVIRPSSLVVTCPPSTPVRVGLAYSATCSVVGGTPPYTWSIASGHLPNGLTLVRNNASAQVAGTPLTPASFAYTIRVADSAPTPQVATYSYSGTIQPAIAPLIVKCEVPVTVSRVGVAYSASCSATGGVRPYLWLISAGNLPPGFRLTANAASASIAGTPTTMGSYTYEVKVVDSDTSDPKVSIQLITTLVQSPPLSASCSTLYGPERVSSFYSATCDATGGTGPYTWSLGSGTLPAGLTISSRQSSAIISGVPASTGSFSYSIQVTDASNPVPQTTSLPYAGIISGPPPPLLARSGIVSAATYSPAVSRGAVAALFGSNLADSTVAASSVPLPRSLAGVRVTVNRTDAPLWFVSPGQINFQIPYESPLEGLTSIQVVRSGAQSQVVDFELQPYAPGIFTYVTGDGATAPIITHADGTLLSTARPGYPGELVTIWATGIGDLSPVPQTGNLSGVAVALVAPSITIAGVRAELEYAGLAPGGIGLAQFNVRIPESLSGGSHPLLIRFDKAASPPVAIPIAVK